MLDQERLLDPFALLHLDYEAADPFAAQAAYSGTLEEAQLLSSIYFDSLDATSYQERILRKEGARLVRFRWYGDNAGETDKEIYIERKIHHEGWTLDESVKERCILPQDIVHPYMKGQMDIDAHFKGLAAEGVFSDKSRKAMENICREVNTMIQERKMQPMVRTSYYRCAFQLATSNEVRISLDTQMTLINEFQGEGHPSDAWCLTSADQVSEEEVYRFPFAILEIKLQNVTETPQWLQNILSETEAVQVHKFSKFQHGMAFLHPQRVPILPHWHQDFEQWHQRLENKKHNVSVDHRWTRSHAKSLITSQRSEDEMVPSLKTTVMPNSQGHHLKDLENIDPKAIFANERTLLHYAEKGIYAGSLGIYMLHQDGFVQGAGAVVTLLTCIFFIWALREYYDRLRRITGRAKAAKNPRLRFDWVHGPNVIFAMVVFMLALSIVAACLHIRTGSMGHRLIGNIGGFSFNAAPHQHGS